MSVNTFTPMRSMPGGSRVDGPIDPHPRAQRVEQDDVGPRHPRMQDVAADRHHRPGCRPLLRRMVSASSSAWVGCSCAPSPALTTEQSTLRASRCTAPAAWWRTTIMSGRMAFSVIAVSISVSPFLMEEDADRHVHHVSAEPLAGELEGGLRPGRRLEEQVDLRAAAQRRLLLLDLARHVDRLVGEIEQRRDVLRR